MKISCTVHTGEECDTHISPSDNPSDYTKILSKTNLPEVF